MYQATTFEHEIQTSFKLSKTNINSKISPFMIALSELTDNCRINNKYMLINSRLGEIVPNRPKNQQISEQKYSVHSQKN